MAELQELAGLKYQLGINSPFLQRPFFMHLVYPPPTTTPPKILQNSCLQFLLGWQLPFLRAYFWRDFYSEGLIYRGEFAFQNQLG